MITRACRLLPEPATRQATVYPPVPLPVPVARADEHLGEVELALFRSESSADSASASDRVFRWPVYIIFVTPPAEPARERTPIESSTTEISTSTTVNPLRSVIG